MTHFSTRESVIPTSALSRGSMTVNADACSIAEEATLQ